LHLLEYKDPERVRRNQNEEENGSKICRGLRRKVDYQVL